MNWRQVLGIGMLAGIGFTMSLLIASLAFANDTEVETAKIGTIAASILAGVGGTLVIFKRYQPNEKEEPVQADQAQRKASINSGSASL